MNANSGGEPESKVKLILKERNLDPALTFGMEVCDHRASCDADRTCAVCSQTIPKEDHEYETDTSILCKIHTCIHCDVPTTAVPCEYDSSKPLCVVSNCEYCGESRDLADYTPNGPACKATAYDLCGTSITPVSHNLPYTCKDAGCEICHEIITATESHDLSSDATCIDQTCTVCESIVKASTPHDYIYTQHYKHCGVCNDIVHFQQEDDSSNNWWWIQQQQAQAEAERVAKELQEGSEKQKNAVSVAVGVAAALMCALFLMTEVRRQ
ncbi:MAG: hypothetical protein IKC93_05830 [Candidatus Methanomethylophilaceae archaeon]|nr:hypothetical protein [Candidatus Methanomethylophilaceae archaeon]